MMEQWLHQFLGLYQKELSGAARRHGPGGAGEYRLLLSYGHGRRDYGVMSVYCLLLEYFGGRQRPWMAMLSLSHGLRVECQGHGM